MAIVIPCHDENVMPLTLGHPLRTPSEDWPKYGIKWATSEEFNRLLDMGRNEYRREWAQGDKGQHEVVAEASRKAFGGENNNQLLRDVVGRVAAKHLEVKSSERKLFYVLDIGAGAGDSFITFLKNLPNDFRGGIHAVLLDPSEKSLRTAEESIKKYGIDGYTIILGTMDEIPKYIKKKLNGRKMDVMLNVASIHHDPDLPNLWKIFYFWTKEGGIFASGDWHPQAWQNPAYVLKMLETNWPEHEEAIKNFKETYHVKTSKLPEDPMDKKACLDIFKFWKAYHEGLLERGGDDGSNSIWPLESHQDYTRYLRDMEKAGYIIEKEGYLGELLHEARVDNPHQFYPDSTIIMGTFGYKPAKNLNQNF